MQMRHLAAYLLLQLGGNASPSAKDIKSVLSAVGIEADDDRLDKLISELGGKDIGTVRIRCMITIHSYHLTFIFIFQLIAEGSAKFASVCVPAVCRASAIPDHGLYKYRCLLEALPLAVGRLLPPVVRRQQQRPKKRSRKRKKRRSVPMRRFVCHD